MCQSRQPKLQFSYPLLKRVLDITIALCFLFCCAPLFNLIAVLILIEDKGPILYRQKRVGKNGRVFYMLKFRTMFVRVDEIMFLRSLQTKGFDFRKLDVFKKLKCDPRITGIGRYLRRTGLDNMPQIVNVLKGDMSMVGPRPHRPFEVQHYNSRQRERLSCRPGLTGLWQTEGNSHDSFDKMIKTDISYIRNQSLSLDLRILANTVFLSITGRNII